MSATQNVHRLLRSSLEHALEASGCPRSQDMTDFLLQAVQAGNNPNVVGDDGILAPSTYSTRLAHMDWRRFEEEVTLALRSQLRRVLAQFPPDHGVIDAVLDPHEEAYHPGTRKAKRIRPLVARTQFLMRSSAGNKNSRYCHRILGGVVTWRHRGQVITWPLLLKVMGAAMHLPRDHVDAMCGTLRRLGIRPRFLLLDRGYDSQEVRRVVKAYGIPLGVRLKSEANARKHLYLASGRSIRLADAIALAMKATRPEVWPSKRFGNTVFHEYVIQAALEEEGPVYDIGLFVAVEPDRRGALPKWKWDPSRSMFLCFPEGTGSRAARRAYRVRWAVEDYYRDLVMDKASPRAKTIIGFVVNYYAQLLRMTFGLLLRNTWRLKAWSEGRSKWRIPRLTIKRAVRRLDRLIGAPGPP